MSVSDTIIEIKDLSKIYKNGAEVHALKSVNLTVSKGEFMSIIGPSGSGKSTLLHIIGILDTPSKGTILIDGKDVSKMSDSQRSRTRNEKLGFVFQYHHLLPDFSALENVMMPLLISGKSDKEAKNIAERLLKDVGLEDRLDHRPNQLSGGQCQRVAVARALANNPDIVIGDELTGNLDTKSSEMIYDLLRKLNSKYQQTFIIVTHDPKLAEKTDRIVRIVDGQIVSS
ncbi:ABC transporter related protein [Methanosalsum zhilinae DSM 4017]|uniref:ABC transporter related protein n=1 Tax=Methanosalsum zhilinae (strain DSM 4017 / NBRC 107636 / OCM 62 / WeN5) TaxID=679901 RepID=F7XLM1_METZD|nr:ABC transporter ATP-binding protein [Methanosalsum zhilinae]AEH60841.1 ABC transporter related protein [Methanosalsum zhilinae DSM 4017]